MVGVSGDLNISFIESMEHTLLIHQTKITILYNVQSKNILKFHNHVFDKYQITMYLLFLWLNKNFLPPMTNISPSFNSLPISIGFPLRMTGNFLLKFVTEAWKIGNVDNQRKDHIKHLLYKQDEEFIKVEK